MQKLAEHEIQIKGLWDQYSVRLLVFFSVEPLRGELPVRFRAPSCCRVNSANPAQPSSILATGCFGGELRLWDLAQSLQLRSWKAHSDRICSIAWSPLSSLACAEGLLQSQSHTAAFATASSDSTPSSPR